MPYRVIGLTLATNALVGDVRVGHQRSGLASGQISSKPTSGDLRHLTGNPSDDPDGSITSALNEWLAVRVPNGTYWQRYA
jgi:hypothetical protein